MNVEAERPDPDPESQLNELRHYEADRRERVWWVWAVGVYLVAFAAPVLVAVIVVALQGGSADRIGEDVGLAASIVTGIVLAAGSLWAARRIGVGAADLGWRWRGLGVEWRNVGLGVLIAAALQIFAILYAVVLDAFGVEIDALAPYESARAGIVVSVLFAVTAIVVAPVGEELFYRGLITSMIDRRFGRSPRPALRGNSGRWINVLIVSAIFAVSHLIPAAMVQLFVLAIMLGWARLSTGSLVVPITAHAANNAVSVSVLLAG